MSRSQPHDDGRGSRSGTDDHLATLGPDTPEDEYDLQESLSALSTLAGSTMPLSRVLTRVAEYAVGAIPGADGAGVTMYQDDKPATIVASAQFVSEVDDIQYGIGEGPCISAARTGKTVRSGSLGGSAQWPRFGPRVGALGVNSVLSLPLIAADGVIGAMNVYAYAEDAFDDRATELGEMYAIPAAVTVHNARALTAAMELTRHLEQAVSNRAVIDQAIGILISRNGGAAADAFARLRGISRDENTRLVDVAQELVDEAVRLAQARHH